MSERILYTLDEAAEKCSVSKSTIEKAIRQGHLRKTKVGKLARIHTDHLHAWCRKLAVGDVVADSLPPEKTAAQVIEKRTVTR